jgi:hypothetical protein
MLATWTRGIFLEPEQALLNLSGGKAAGSSKVRLLQVRFSLERNEKKYEDIYYLQVLSHFRMLHECIQGLKTADATKDWMTLVHPHRHVSSTSN